MIRLSRYELLSLARAFVLANTPYSLYSELVADPAVGLLRRTVTQRELINYYNFITARAKRTEIVMGLSYGVLIALLLQMRDMGNLSNPPFDSSRLQWGPQIQEYLQIASSGTQILQLDLAQTTTKIISDFGSKKIWQK
jgi:hypothetical protein